MKLKFHEGANTLLELFHLLWNNNEKLRFQLILSGFLILLTSTLFLILPWFLKFIVENLSIPNNQWLIFYLLSSYGILWTFIQVLIQVRQTVAYRVFERSINKVCFTIFKNLLSFPLSFHVYNATGSLMNAIERSQIHMPNVYFCMIFIIIPMIFEIFFAAILLGIYYGVTFSITLLAFLFLYITFCWCCINWIVAGQREGNYHHRRVSSYITDILLNIEGIHYQLSYEPVLKECTERLSQREDAIVRKTMRVDFVAMGQSLITGLCFTFVTIIVGFDVFQNKLGVSDFVLINGYLLQFLIPLNMMGISVFKNIKEGLTSLEEVVGFMRDSHLLEDKKLPFMIKEEACEIKFKKVNFSYPHKSNLALKNVSFTIPSGKATAIVGTNGSGKSTLTKLIYKFYEPTNGSIIIQGKDIKTVNNTALRSIIGVVPQETFLLNDTVYKNLSFGDYLNLNSEFFQNIASITNLDKWIKSLPQGYDTVVGERGVQLSGGEKQRIGIARALLKKPKILIFDEATASLDFDTEEKIFNHILKDYKGITRIIITHNMKILDKIDKIIRIENGNIMRL